MEAVADYRVYRIGVAHLCPPWILALKLWRHHFLLDLERFNSFVNREPILVLCPRLQIVELDLNPRQFGCLLDYLSGLRQMDPSRRCGHREPRLGDVEPEEAVRLLYSLPKELERQVIQEVRQMEAKQRLAAQNKHLVMVNLPCLKECWFY